MTDRRPVTITIPGELVSNVRIAIEARAKEFKANKKEARADNAGVAAERWAAMAAGLTRLAEKLK